MRTSISNLESALSNCMKCGFCKAACPVFTNAETTSPRAKVRLAKAVACGEIELGPGVRHQMERCLNCRACSNECPSGVEPNRIAMAVRNAVVEQQGLPLSKHLAFHTALPHPRLMATGSRMLGLAQRISGIDQMHSPIRKLLPLIGMRTDKDLPMLGKRPLLARLPEMVEPMGRQSVTVLYFPGCATNLIYPETGEAVVSVLRKLGARVIIPHDIVCCSTPVFNSGDIVKARELARRNIGIMSQISADLIVTACGSCGLTIKHEWQDTLGLSEAAPLAGKVVDIHEFVARYAVSNALQEIEGTETVTYHDSCHLRRGLGVYKEPRQLLRAALGDRFIEMEQADRCCGGGGTFSLYHPDLSQQIAQTKMYCLAASGAEIVTTGCPACIMQLRDSIVHRNMPHHAIHSIEILNRALNTNPCPPAPA